MILFFDQDIGKGVPEALRAVKIPADYVGRRPDRGLALGVSDEEWLVQIGKRGYLAFSCNKAILRNEAERDIIFKEKVGIVFLTTGQENKVEVLSLVLKELDWLRYIHENVPRPFVFTINMSRQKRQVIGEVDFEEWKRRQEREQEETR